MARLNILVIFLLCSRLSTCDNNATCHFENNFENIYVCRYCAILKCASPTEDEILEAMINVNLSGIQNLQMSENNITVLSEGTFHFDKLSGIKELDLSYNSLSELPDDLFNYPALVNLEKLILDYNEISLLKSVQFSVLSGLKYLQITYNKIQIVEPEVFTSISNSSLQSIDLSDNEIGLNELPEDLLANLTHLIELELSNNQISQIPKCVLTSLYLKSVFLNVNNITHVPTLPNAYSPKLEILCLPANNMVSISPDMFASNNWKALKILMLAINKITHLPPNLFSSSSLERLEYINVAYNDLTELPEGLFDNPVLTNLKKLDFSVNCIDRLSEKLLNSSNLGKLEIIYLNRNQIKVLPVNLFQNNVLQNLRTIDLGYNEIEHIPAKFFKCLENIESIYLNNNKIKIITADMFSRMENLFILDLSYNLIFSIKEMLPLFLFTRQHLPLFEVSYNNLTVQEPDFISADANINLAFNKISSFGMFSSNRDFRWNNYHYKYKVLRRTFDIQGNGLFSVINLITVSLGIDLTKMYQLNPNMPLNILGLKRLYTLINYFRYSYRCNCDMLAYLKLQETNSFKLAFDIIQKSTPQLLPNDFNRLLCGYPERLSGRYLNELKETDLQCSVLNCTNEPKCTCVHTPHNSTVRINCTGIDATKMPEILSCAKVEIYFGFNKLKTFPVLMMAVTQRICLLDLSHNSITALPSLFLSSYLNLTMLNLVGNLLTNLPSSPKWKNMKSLRFLELSENRFVCNCSGLELQKTLLYLNNRVDINLIKCYTPLTLRNEVIYTLPESVFGCAFINLTLILTLSLSLLLLFVIVIFIVYVFRYYIHLCLFVHCGWRFYYEYPDEETMYDVFISYSSLDSDWVINNLVNRLEGMDPPYNLCLHERDFVIGEPICNNITRAVEGSKCTLVVVSRNWLESQWCQFEFRIAHCLAHLENRSRLLVLLMEEIPVSKVKGDLKFYMKTFTYLDSSHQLFWPRLLNDLPAPYVVGHLRDEASDEGTLEVEPLLI